MCIKKIICKLIDEHGFNEVLKAVKAESEERGNIGMADYIGEAIIEQEKEVKK